MIIAGIALCLAALVGLGLLSARRINGRAHNFLLAGRTLGAPLIAVLCMSQVIDANATIGAADLSAEFGFWAGAALPVGIAVSVLLMGIFVAKPLRATGILTLPEFFAHRFGRGTEITASILTVASFGILLAGNLVALGYLIEYFLDLPYSIAILVLIPLVLAYTMAGGMFASAYTGILQFVIMVVGIIALVIWTATTIGFSAPAGMGADGWPQLTQAAEGAAINWATIIALGLGNLVAIDLVQRVLSARSPEAARRACFGGAIGIVLLCVPLSFVALAALDVVGDTGGTPILYVLLGEHTPVVLSILLLSGLVTASVTTVSGILLSASTVVVHDVLRLDGHDRTQSLRVMRATRFTMIPMAALGALVALRVQQTGILLTLTFDLLLAGLVVPFVLGLFWKRGDARAVAISLTAGITVRVVFFVLTPTIYGVDNTLLYFENSLVSAAWDGWSTLLAAGVSLVLYVAVSLATKPALGATEPVVPQVEPDTSAAVAPPTAVNGQPHAVQTEDAEPVPVPAVDGEAPGDRP